MQTTAKEHRKFYCNGPLSIVSYLIKEVVISTPFHAVFNGRKKNVFLLKKNEKGLT